MTVKQGMFGKPKFEGRVKDWMDHFEQWYRHDFPTGALPYDRYLGMLLARIIPVFQDAVHEQGSPTDVQELEAILMVWKGSSPAREWAKYDFADFAANRTTWDKIQEVLQECRRLTIEAWQRA